MSGRDVERSFDEDALRVIAVAEIGPRSFERELRVSRGVVVVDTRDAEAFAAWHADPGVCRLINLPEAEVAADVRLALARLPAAAPLRLICTAGNSSRRVAALLAERGVASLSVRGGLICWSRLVEVDEVPLAGPFRVVQFRREARGCLSYLVVAGDDALVVDPGPEVEPYLAEAAARGVRITSVFDTHVHADHLSGARELADRADAVLHLPAASLLRGCRHAGRVASVADGDSIEVGAASVRVVALPGHTSDMTGLLLGELALLAGDSLFLDSVARPDLEHGDDGAAAGARELHRTLRERIAALPDATVLLPAHYPGGRVDGPVAGTLGAVRRAMPELALGEAAFVARVLEELPERPANYTEIIAVNLGPEPPGPEVAHLEVGANNCAVSAARPPSTPTPSGRP